MGVTPKEVYTMMVYQIGALDAFAKAEGAKLQHVKAHGALYNMAAKDPKLAEALAESLYKVNPELILFGLAGSEMIKAAEKLQLKVAQEVFADRTYQNDGALTPRSQSNALITEDDVAIAQVLRMVSEGVVRSVQGDDVPLKADTICVHGDGEHAISFARRIRESLIAEGIEVCAFR